MNDDVLTEVKKKLKKKGYDSIEIYTAQPREEDLDHSHKFDTYILMLEGEMLVRMNEKEKTLIKKEEIFIPRKVTHYSKVGDAGCKFLHAERH